MSKARRLRKAAKKQWRWHRNGDYVYISSEWKRIEELYERFLRGSNAIAITIPYTVNDPFFIGIDPARPGSDVTVNCVFIDDLETTAPSVPKETPSE